MPIAVAYQEERLPGISGEALHLLVLLERRLAPALDLLTSFQSLVDGSAGLQVGGARGDRRVTEGLRATLHNPPCGWTPYRAADGRRYYDDGRGRTIAVLTSAGEVVPGPGVQAGPGAATTPGADLLIGS
jgi:hypothetical protein